MPTDDLLARLDCIVHSDAPYGTILRDTVRDAAAEVRALTARLDAAQPLIDAAIRHSDNIHGVHAENRQAVRLAVTAYRAATADPTPQTEDT